MRFARIASSAAERYQHETLQLLDGLVGVDGAVFYAVDSALNAVGHVLYRVGSELLPEYLRYFHRLDPLHPRRAAADEMLVTLDQVLPEPLRGRSRYYREFMRPIGAHHEAEIYLRDGGELVGGISLLRGDLSPAFTPAELRLLGRVGPFLELGYRELRRRGTLSLDCHCLTTRETEVVQGVCAGQSNAELARDLGVSLSTVKTHLEHVYTKLGVRSRTRLMARLSGERGAHTFGR